MEMRRDLNELASMLFPDPADVVREGLGGILPPTYEGGVALADSEGGAVRVLPDGTVTTWADGDPDGTAEDAADPDAEAAEPVTVPCTANIREGDRVLLVVQDGAYVDCMAAGSGDRVAATASRAEAISTATQQHFWADDNGIHVSTDENDSEGANNILINSLGILLRELTTVLLELSSAGVIVGDQSGTHLAIDNNSVDVLDGSNSKLFTMEALSSIARLLTNLSGIFVGVPSTPTQAAHVDISTGTDESQVTLRTILGAGTKQSYVNAQVTDTAAYVTMSAGWPSHPAEISLSANGSAGTADIVADDVTVNNAAPIVVERKTAITIASTAVRNNANGSASVAKTGYTPVGFQWWWSAGTHQNFFSDYGTHIENNTFYYRFCNLGNANANGTLEYQILYIRDELL